MYPHILNSHKSVSYMARTGIASEEVCCLNGVGGLHVYRTLKRDLSRGGRKYWYVVVPFRGYFPKMPKTVALLVRKTY